jgi:branched-subunit amino acid ABC-type transport system permease component
MHTPSAAAPTYRSVSISLHKQIQINTQKIMSLLAYFIFSRVVFGGVFRATSTETSVSQLLGM